MLAGGDGEFNGLPEELSAMQERDAKAASRWRSQSRRFALHAGASVDDINILLNVLDGLLLITFYTDHVLQTTCYWLLLSGGMVS